ncbi:MAG: hypothetical protein WCW68_06705, partial [Methanothrix sp.]
MSAHIPRPSRAPPDALAFALARAPGSLVPGKMKTGLQFFSQIYKPEMTSIPYGHYELSLLRHPFHHRLHDRP